MPDKSLVERYTLLTNLDSVTIGSLRMFCHALLLEEASGLERGRLQCKVRGFKTDPALEVFDLFLPGDRIEYELVPASSAAIFIGSDGTQKPLSTGAILKITHFPIPIQLVAYDSAHPVHADTFEGPVADNVVLRVWQTLPQRVRQYWTAPYMPFVQYVPR